MKMFLFFFFVLLLILNQHFVAGLDLMCTPLSELNNLDVLTQEQFTNVLTDPCRYDKHVKPRTKHVLPVFIRMDLNHIQKHSQVQFSAVINVQYRYVDKRLNFANLSSFNSSERAIFGGETLKTKIWIPHVVMKNEKSTKMIDFGGSNIIVALSPHGEVVYTYTMSATFYCWMDLKKFPFDSQNCTLTWSSWTYTTNDVMLLWDTNNPVEVDEIVHLPEFIISAIWTSETTANQTLLALVRGNFSEINFTFNLHRQIGFYMLEYYLPSILLVCTSWVSFWLQADATPPRAILGTSTFLAFITLNGGLTKNIPKVSYIKASDVWFLVCSCFIFGSLAEFAFANVIWRRNKRIEVGKQKARNILRGAITPRQARKQIRKAKSMAMLCRERPNGSNAPLNLPEHYLTMHEYPKEFPKVSELKSNASMVTLSSSNEEEEKVREEATFIAMPNANIYTMTPQEVSIWLDRKARIAFPVAFLIFNGIYWTLVYLV